MQPIIILWTHITLLYGFIHASHIVQFLYEVHSAAHSTHMNQARCTKVINKREYFVQCSMWSSIFFSVNYVVGMWIRNSECNKNWNEIKWNIVVDYYHKRKDLFVDLMQPAKTFCARLTITHAHTSHMNCRNDRFWNRVAFSNRVVPLIFDVKWSIQRKKKKKREITTKITNYDLILKLFMTFPWTTDYVHPFN